MIAVENNNKYWKHHRKSVKGFRVPSTGFYLEGHGSTDAGTRIWRPAMSAAMKGRPDVNFHQPPGSILHGKRVPVPSLYGMSYAAAAQKLRKAGFTVENAYVYSNRPKGTGLGWSPRPGSYTSQFGTIYWTISKGRDPAQVAAEKKAKKKAAHARRRRRRAPGATGWLPPS